MDNDNKAKIVAFSAIISAIIVFIATLVASVFFDFHGIYLRLIGDDSDRLSKLEGIFNNVSEYFIDDVDREKLIDGAISGMMDVLDDKYSFYLTEAQYNSMQSSKNPTYVGIGIISDLTSVEDAILVSSLIDGGSAGESGILEGDAIIRIDGNKVTADNKYDLVLTISGDEGTSVNLVVLRNGEEISFSVERRTIPVPLSFAEVINDNVGYIRFSSFSYEVLDDFEKGLDNLLEKNVGGLIIDLRGNHGGYKDIATKLAGYFLENGSVICSVENRYGRVSVDYSLGHKVDLPLVVLVDKESASASELFAGAIQDNGVGMLVGTTTFGKGIVQYTYTLSDGSYYQFTAEQWFTPNGSQIHGIGLTPDIEVEISEELADSIHSNRAALYSPDVDAQLKTAINVIQEALQNAENTEKITNFCQTE